jgi:butyrate response factor 1
LPKKFQFLDQRTYHQKFKMGSLATEQSRSALLWKTTWDTPISAMEPKQKKSETKLGVALENSAKSAKAQDSLENIDSAAPDAAAAPINFLDVKNTQAWNTLSVLIAQKSAEEEKAAKIEEELSRQNLYKTELCRSFVDTGFCRYGVKCQFAHGSHEIRPVMRHPKYKTETCKNFASTGHCPYGARCRFIHPGVVQQANDIAWSSNWNPDTPAGIPSKKTVPEDVQEDIELEGTMKRLAIFQTIAH